MVRIVLDDIGGAAPAVFLTFIQLTLVLRDLIEFSLLSV